MQTRGMGRVSRFVYGVHGISLAVVDVRDRPPRNTSTPAKLAAPHSWYSRPTFSLAFSFIAQRPDYAARAPRKLVASIADAARVVHDTR